MLVIICIIWFFMIWNFSLYVLLPLLRFDLDLQTLLDSIKICIQTIVQKPHNIFLLLCKIQLHHLNNEISSLSGAWIWTWKIVLLNDIVPMEQRESLLSFSRSSMKKPNKEHGEETLSIDVKMRQIPDIKFDQFQVNEH